jgi:hypothetical protein
MVFGALMAILLAYEDRLNITKHTAEFCFAYAAGLRLKGHPVAFAAVRWGKNYANFHFVQV